VCKQQLYTRFNIYFTIIVSCKKKINLLVLANFIWLLFTTLVIRRGLLDRQHQEMLNMKLSSFFQLPPPPTSSPRLAPMRSTAQRTTASGPPWWWSTIPLQKRRMGPGSTVLCCTPMLHSWASHSAYCSPWGRSSPTTRSSSFTRLPSR